MLVFILALRVLLSPLTNVFQKKLAEKGAHSLFIVALTYLVIALLFVPVALVYHQPLSTDFWSTIVLASVIDAAGNVFLVKSLETTELSVFGPINSFKPAVALVIGFFLLNEVPSGKALAGVCVILAGSVLLTLKRPKGAVRLKGLFFRIAGIVCSSFGAVLIKKAILYSSPELSLFYWSLVALPLFALLIGSFYKNIIATNYRLLLQNKKPYIWLFLSYFAMQYVTLLSFKVTFVGYSLAIFQLSSIVSIILGYRYFDEKGIWLKLFSALVMMAGALLILFP